MSDEIKPEGPKVEPIAELTETALEQVAGGKASPVLMQACATGAHIKEGTITE